MTAVPVSPLEPEPDPDPGDVRLPLDSSAYRGCELAADDAFEAWLRENRSLLMSVAGRVCRDRALAEDAVQDACLRMWLMPREEIRDMSAFARTVTHHAAVDLLRRRRDSLIGDDALEAVTPHWPALPAAPEMVTGTLMAWLDVQEVVGNRAAAILYLTGLRYTDAEICALLGMPAEKCPQIRMMRTRARAKLRARGLQW